MVRRIQPFDDSLQKDRRRGTTNPSTNTSPIDAYRQGIELTRPSHFVNGIAKIHDGYNDQTGEHGVPDLVLGQSRPILRDDNSYLEMVKFNSLSHVYDPPGTDVNALNRQLLEDVASKDGAVEPLELRDVVTRRTHLKDVVHKMCGALDEGNVNDRTSSEVFITQAIRNDLHVGTFPFEDEADVMVTMPLASEQISTDNRKHGPFLDNQECNGIIVSNLTMENDLIAALRAMRPPSENALPPTHIQVGATGFY